MALDALTIGGDRAIPDSSVYLALRDAYWRLDTDQSPELIASVVSQLWDLALRIEDGNIPEAERDVKAAQDRLSEALKQNASPEEIDRLVDELRTALSRYLQALAEQAQQKGNLPPEQKSKNGDQVVSDQELDKLLNNIQQLAKSGSKELAEQMLNELKDVLERLQTGTFADNAKQQRVGKMMKDLNDLVSKQQKLLDETFNAKRQQGGRQDPFELSPPGQPMEFGNGMFMQPFGAPEEEGSDNGQTPGGNDSSQGKSGGHGQQRGEQQAQRQGGQFDDLGKRQGELRDALQSLIDRFRIEGASPPQQFDDAGKAMGDAKEALGKSNLDRATEQQGRALDQLRQGAQSLAEQMMENGETQAGKGQGKSGKDPLGRPDRSNRPDLGLSVKVPDQIDIQKAREVLDELRRRPRRSVAADDRARLSRAPDPALLAGPRQFTDKGKLAVAVVDIHAVADHEHRRAGKPDEVGRERRDPGHLLVDQHASEYLACSALQQKRLGEAERAARVRRCRRRSRRCGR